MVKKLNEELADKHKKKLTQPEYIYLIKKKDTKLTPL